MRRESGHSRDLGLFTRGNEAGKDVKRKRVIVVGEAVSTLSDDDSRGVSSTVLAAVVPVLCHWDIDLAVPNGPVRRFGVMAGGERGKEEDPDSLPLPKIEPSSLTFILGGDVNGDEGKWVVGGITPAIGDSPTCQ